MGHKQNQPWTAGSATQPDSASKQKRQSWWKQETGRHDCYISTPQRRGNEETGRTDKTDDFARPETGPAVIKKKDNSVHARCTGGMSN